MLVHLIAPGQLSFSLVRFLRFVLLQLNFILGILFCVFSNIFDKYQMNDSCPLQAYQFFAILCVHYSLFFFEADSFQKINRWIVRFDVCKHERLSFFFCSVFKGYVPLVLLMFFWKSYWWRDSGLLVRVTFGLVWETTNQSSIEW